MKKKVVEVKRKKINTVRIKQSKKERGRDEEVSKKQSSIGLQQTHFCTLPGSTDLYKHSFILIGSVRKINNLY